jgi:hypothetical protein
MIRVFAFFAVFLYPLMALAQAAPNPNDPGGLVNTMVKSLQQGNKWMAVSCLLMLLTYALNRGILGQRIPPNLLPWVAALLAVATNITVAITGGMAWTDAVLNGLTQGAAAAGLWSMAGKHFLKKKEERIEDSDIIESDEKPDASSDT